MGMVKRLTLEKVKTRLKEINPNIEILSNEYVNSKSKLICKCLIDNHVWEATYGNLSAGKGCPVCVRKKAEDEFDITGKKFGKLTAVKVSRKQKAKSGTKIYWLCKCECGNEKEVLRYNIVSGSTTSCGCAKKESTARIGKNKIKDISGERFGRFTVLERADNKYGKTAWLCICDCGNEKVVSKTNLVTGGTISCGCYAKERSKGTLKEIHARTSERYNEIGNRYNRLLVIEEVEPDKNGFRRFLCHCDCGNKHVVSGAKLRNGNTQSCGCYNKDCRVGEKSYRYNHNLTDEDRFKRRYELNGKHLKKWSRSVLVRDKFTCKVCGSYSKELNAHHLDGWNWCKEKRFDVSNGVTLCKCCHTDFHKKYGYGNNTKWQFDDYINSKVTR